MMDRTWFGVNIQLPRRHTDAFPYPAESDRPYDVMRSVWTTVLSDRIHFVRVGQWGDRTSWDNVERRKGDLRLDPDVVRALQEAKEAGVAVQLTLCYGNALYCGPGPRPTQPVPNQWTGSRSIFYAPRAEEAVQAFARYCRFMARELRGLVSMWEIWNEENLGTEGGGYFWSPAPSPWHYMRLLKEAIEEIRAEDVATPIMLGGLAGVDLEYLQACLELGAGHMVQAVAVHPYRPATFPEAARVAGGPSYIEELAAVRALLKDYGASALPVWVNELGWAVEPPERSESVPFPALWNAPVSEAVQAEYLGRAYLLNLAHGYPSAWWWALNAERDAIWGRAGTPDEGLFRPDGSPRLAYNVLRRLCRAIMPDVMATSRPQYFQVRSDEPQLQVVEVTRGSEVELWMWLARRAGEGPICTVDVSLPYAGSWALWSLLTDQVKELPGAGQRCQVEVGTAPVCLRPIGS